MIVELGTGAVVLGGAVHGAFHRNSFLFGRPITRLNTTARSVALTFDDGPNVEATPAILDALKARGVRATFFVLGRHAEQWPELVKRVADEGHAIGNHGYFHRKLHFKSPSYVRSDLTLGTEAIERASGCRPRLFRAPHGFRSPWVSSIAGSLGQRTVGCMHREFRVEGRRGFASEIADTPESSPGKSLDGIEYAAVRWAFAQRARRPGPRKPA